MLEFSPAARRWRLCALLAGAVLFTAAPALAMLCGDDVDGRDVPCNCGDIVVSDLVLDDDPVRDTPCRGDGLVVRAPRAVTRGLNIDLAGAHLRGLGRGTGLRILSGGSGGARVFSSGAPAVIEGFRDGLVSQASRSGLAEARDLRLVGQQRDGVRIFGDGLLLRNIEVTASQRDGVFVRGDGWTVEDVRVRQNGRHGLAVMGAGNTIHAAGAAASVRAEGNGEDGIRLWGESNLLRDCIAAGNRASGVALNGVGLDVRDCDASANGTVGLSGSASLSRFYGNVATENLEGGIAVHGHSLFDAGANVGDGNFAASPTSKPVQCRLGLEDCL